MRHLVRDDFVITGLQDAVLDNFQNLGNGEYSFDITNSTAETIVLTITVDGITIDDHPEIIFWNILFAEDFSNVSAGDLPTDWSRDNYRWGVYNYNHAGGTSPELRFENGQTVSGEFSVSTDYIDASQASNLKLTFKHLVNHVYGSYILKVQTSVNGTDWVERWSIQPSGDIPGETVTIDLSALAGESFKIAWVFDGETYYMNDWYIDDIVLEQNL